MKWNKNKCIKNKRELQIENDNLIVELRDKINDINTMRNKIMYDIPIRKCIYHCLLNNACVETAATVIEIVVKEMTGKCVQSLSSVVTISRMAYEMGC